MYIKELACKSSNKHMTVHLSYEEIRDISNALYYLTSGNKPEQDYSKIAAKCSFLFDMIKHGMIQPNTVSKLEAEEKKGLRRDENDETRSKSKKVD